MGIGISTITFDLTGARVFPVSALHDHQKIRSAARRVTRTPTLDGGVAVYDTGYAPGDRQMTLNFARPSRELVDWLKYIVRNYGLVQVATDEGCFLAIPSAQDYAERPSLRLLITEELTS